MSAPRRPEGGYALVVAALAVLFLAVVTSVIVHAGAMGATSSVLEVQQEQARAIAAAGAEWGHAQDMNDAGSPTPQTLPFAGGSFTVTRPTGALTIRSEGVLGDARRVVLADRTLFYVPDSRFPGSDTSLASFEMINRTGANVDVTGITLEYASAPAAFYEGVRLVVFGTLTTPPVPGVDYGTIWTWTTGGRRAASGEQIAVNPARRISAGRQVLFEVAGFRTSATGSNPGDVNISAVPLRITLSTAQGALPGVAVPAVKP